VNGELSAARPITDPLLSAIGATAFVGALSVAALAMFRDHLPVLAVVPSYVPIMHGVSAFVALSIGMLAFERYRAAEAPMLFWIGAAFTSSAVCGALLVLASPGLLSDGRALIARLQGTYGYFLALSAWTLSVFLLLAVFSPWPRVGAPEAKSWRWLILAWLGILTLGGLVSLVFEESLPGFFESTGGVTWRARSSLAVWIAAFGIGAVASASRYRSTGDRLAGYLALFEVTLILAFLALGFEGRRYDLWFYLSRGFMVLGFSEMALGLLADSAGVFRREQEKTRALRESEQQFRRMFERHTAVMLLIAPTTGTIVDANPAAAAFYGYSREQLRALCIQDINQLPPDAVAAERLKALAEERSYFVFPHRLADGRVRWVEVYSSPVVGSDQPLLFSVIHDITERRQAEQALQNAHDALEERIQERTAELSQAMQTLVKQSRELQALASELTLAEQRERRRLAEVLHDGLQQILVGVKFRVAALGRAENASVQGGWLEVAKLVETALAYSRSLILELSPPILYTDGLVPALEWLARSMGETHGLAVDLWVHENTPAETSEEVRVLLFKSIRELLFNVVKHAQVPAARVEIEHHDGRLHVAVSDKGVGFDPAHLRAMGGTDGGFGLFSIRHRLELLGGRLTVDGAPGQGSRFALSVPLRM
jgi:PAS domain S-box-containing protein